MPHTCYVQRTACSNKPCKHDIPRSPRIIETHYGRRYHSFAAFGPTTRILVHFGYLTLSPESQSRSSSFTSSRSWHVVFPRGCVLCRPIRPLFDPTDSGIWLYVNHWRYGPVNHLVRSVSWSDPIYCTLLGWLRWFRPYWVLINTRKN